jgi:hypothetical protein
MTGGEGWEPCEEYGHRYTIEPDPEVYGACIDCGEPRDTDEDESEDTA